MKASRRSLLRVSVLLSAAALLVWREPLWVIDHAVRLHLWRQGVVSRYVQVDGHRIHYVEAGAAHGVPDRPLVLIHGLGAKAEDWAPMLPELARQGFHVYALDLLGYGQSARPHDASYSIREEEHVVAGFMRALHLGRTDVGGWSMGGWVAMRLALERPELVRRMVLYDSAGVYFAIDSPETLFAPTSPAQFRRLAERLTTRRIPGFLIRDGLRRQSQNGWVIRRTVAAMTSGSDLLDFRLAEIHRPTLIVWGAQDHLIPPQVGEELHRDIADSALAVVPGCGHLLPAECWRQAVTLTVNFLDQKPVQTATQREARGPVAARPMRSAEVNPPATRTRSAVAAR